jgi:hypothetical protein
LLNTQTISSAIKFFFQFKKPSFIVLDFVDLIIDDHPIFLIVWKIKHGYKLTIKPIKGNYSQSGSLVLKIPKNIYSIELIASNFWRSNKKPIEFKHFKFDKETASYLIQKFQPISTIEIKRTIVLIKNKEPIVKSVAIFVKPTKIYLKKTFKLIREQINYP